MEGRGLGGRWRVLVRLLPPSLVAGAGLAKAVEETSQAILSNDLPDLQVLSDSGPSAFTTRELETLRGNPS